MTTLPKTADTTIDHPAARPWDEVFQTIAACMSQRSLPAPSHISLVHCAARPHFAMTCDSIAAARRWSNVLGTVLYDGPSRGTYDNGAPYVTYDHEWLGWQVSVTGSDRPAHRLVAAAVLTPDASDLPQAEAASGVSDRG